MGQENDIPTEFLYQQQLVAIYSPQATEFNGTQEADSQHAAGVASAPLLPTSEHGLEPHLAMHSKGREIFYANHRDMQHPLPLEVQQCIHHTLWLSIEEFGSAQLVEPMQ